MKSTQFRWKRNSMRIGMLCLVSAACASGQWQMQTSNTTADLRGIHNVGGGVAWASGTNGTVLRTEDGGYVWQTCAVPPGAEKLDFRGVQGFDANTAIVMSSGKGDLSRLYKTTDGCHTWKLIFANPDKDGFWDAVKFDEKNYGMILGDPVEGQFAVFVSLDGGRTWKRQDSPGLKADAAKNGVFAASNSSLIMSTMLAHRFFVTGGLAGAFFVECHGELRAGGHPKNVDCLRQEEPLPIGTLNESSGAFALGQSPGGTFLAVGGDYLKPNDSIRTAARSDDVGNWTATHTPPHGYRSSVAYDEKTKTWITVGPNGTDISTDDGKNWRAVHPDAALHEAADADRNWNAISLPYVVGPKGRIGRLEEGAIK